MKEITISSEFITLAQLLKLVGEVESGGQVKEYLRNFTPLINGQPEERRGKKIRPGDVVELQNVGKVTIYPPPGHQGDNL